MARRSEHTQDEIKAMVVKAAETIVVEEGVAHLKVRTVALEIGYTVGSIYMVFKSMAELILHLKERTLADIAAYLQQVPNQEPPQQCLVNLAKAYLHFAQQHYNRWQMLFDHTHTDRDSIPEDYKNQAGKLFNPVAAQFQRLAPGASPEETQRAAIALWGGVHGVCALALTGSLTVVGVGDIEATVVLLVNSFVRGWLADLNQTPTAN